MQLRPNQIEPTNKGIGFFQQSKADPALIIAPTAFGKSVVIAKIAESVNDNLLILQPSKELLEQNFSKYIALGGHATVYSASFNSKRIGDTTYATIGSIKSIGARFKQIGFTKMIIDEAHLYPRESDSMLGQFLNDSGITHVLGLTATPLKLQTNRSMTGTSFSKLVMLTSRSKKGNFFKEIIHVSQINEMVDLEFWCPLQYDIHDFNPSMLVYNSTKAEFTEESVKISYQENEVSNRVVSKVNQLSGRNSILVFVPSVAEANLLASQTPNAAAISAETKPAERNYIIKSFKSGRLKTIYNVNVLSVGFDHPELDTIIMARSTASLAWYYQALGRGTRISQYKKDCLIVDYSGNVKRFGRIEHFYYKKENIWKLYGEGGKLLTGCPIHEIGAHTEETEKAPKKPLVNGHQYSHEDYVLKFGKHQNKKLKEVPDSYLKWMLKEFTWNPRNKPLQDAIIGYFAKKELPIV